jgi:peptidyl-dipeptidase Dcp
MAQQRQEIFALTAKRSAPTFEGVMAAYQDSGRTLNRVGALFGVFTSTMNDAAMQKVEAETTPKLAAFGDEIIQNEQLFARIKAVYDARETSNLTPEQKRLTWVTYNYFARQGAALDAAKKARLGQINQALASLYTKFSQNELADEEGYTLELAEGDLAGLPDSVKAGAAAAAEEKGLKGKWLITNTRSSMEPFLVYSDRRDLREKGWKLWVSRGDNNDAHDNKAVITEILKLRAEKAQLLGFETYAHWITADQMSKTPDAAMDLMMQVWKPAVARVHEEVADMQKVADAEGATFKIAPWDYRHYAEKVRKARYDLDQNVVKPYLQLEKLREAIHWAAGQLYGFTFTQITDVPVCHPDVRVWEVTKGGPNARGPVVLRSLRPGRQAVGRLDERVPHPGEVQGVITPIVSNNCNFVKGKPGEPVLISWDDATTMFHEFGHALHGLNSDVTYPGPGRHQRGPRLRRVPQPAERALAADQAGAGEFAVHYQTGKPIPAELVAKIEKAKTFNQGFSTVEYLASAIYDMKIHLAAKGQAIDPAAFEKTALTEIGLPSEIVMRHRPTQFGHIFSGDGYSAGYYNYIWADTLTADAAEAFEEAPGGFYDKAVAKRLHDDIMSVGNTIDAGEAFRRFRGRDVKIGALMRNRGFPVPPGA